MWLLFDAKKLSSKTKLILENPKNEIYVSKISLWEISLKYGLGKLNLYNSKPDEIEKILLSNSYNILDFNSLDILSFYNLPQNLHKDLFDKMIVWQSIKNNLVLITQDEKLEVYKKVV